MSKIAQLITVSDDKRAYFPSLLLLQWLTFLSALIFASEMAWHYGFIQNIIKTDITMLSVVIALLFLGGTVHCALRCAFLSAQCNALGKISVNISQLEFKKGDQLDLNTLQLESSPIVNYISSILRYQQQNAAGVSDQKLLRLDEVLVEHLKGAHEIGWFLTGLLVKLGLLGTVIGFILMLTSISSVVTLDPSQIHLFFSEMTSGMRIALNTTLIGLLGTMLLGFQYLMLDRGADRLLADTIHFVENIRR